MYKKSKLFIVLVAVVAVAIGVFLFFAQGKDEISDEVPFFYFSEHSIKPVFISQPDNISYSAPLNIFRNIFSESVYPIESSAKKDEAKKREYSFISVTPQELFEFAYPEEYIKVLKELNRRMIAHGFLPSEEIYEINSMDEAVAFQDKFADYLQNYSAANFAQIDIYRKSYREILPAMWEEELRVIKAQKSVSFAPFKIWFKYREFSLRAKTGHEMSILSGIVNKASAQFGGLGGLCFFPGPPNNIPGSQRAAPCCNCFVAGDPVGCLNFVCLGQPAIFDQTTGICGCNI